MDKAPKQLNVLHVSYSDVVGGAARAVYRLHTGLRNIKVNSRLFVFTKGSDDQSVEIAASKPSRLIAKILPRLERLPLRLYPGYVPGRSVPWSSGWLPHPMSRKINRLAPDLVHLHWIGGGFIPIHSLRRIEKPMLWTLHDEWAFTGGCHYTGGCQKFIGRCGACPQLESHTELDLSRWIWRAKSKAWRAANLTIVAPSRWMAGQAKRSSLFQSSHVEVIPNGIDTETYRPLDRTTARKILNLPVDKKLILFGALSSTSDVRKGYHYLEPALQRLASDGWSEKAELIVLGASAPALKPAMGMRDRYMGHLADDISLALAYSAADVFVAPSVQDNLPNTVMEALACGTPSVAFDIGGMPDLIEHGLNGYLARPFEAGDLARGLSWILEDPNRYNTLSAQARQKVESDFAIGTVAGRYLALYENILARSSEVSSIG